MKKFKTISISIIFSIVFFSISLAVENKILFKVNNEIITSIDILTELKYLEIINKDLKKTSNNQAFEIVKRSLIREKIKEIELKKVLKEIKVEEKFLNNLLVDYFKSNNIKKIQAASEKVFGVYMTSINEMSGGIRTIKMSNQEDTEISRMVEASAGIKDLSIKLQKAQALVLPGIDLSSAFVFVLVIGGGGYMVLSDDFQMDGASIITFILGMVIIFDPARGLSQFFAKFQASLILLNSVRALMDTEGEKVISKWIRDKIKSSQ